MESQADRPIIAPQSGTTLQYISTIGDELPALVPENAHVLNQAAEHSYGVKFVRQKSPWDLVWGTLFLYIGLRSMGLMGGMSFQLRVSSFLGLWYVILGLLELGAGVFGYISPTATALAVQGCMVLLLAVLQLQFIVSYSLRSGRAPGPFALLVLAILVMSGVRRLRAVGPFRRASQNPISAQQERWLEQLAKQLKAGNPKHDASFLRVTSLNAWPPVDCRVQLTPGLAIFLMNLTKIRFVPREQIQITSLASSGKRTKVAVMMEGRSFKSLLDAESLRRFEAWQAEGSPAAVVYQPPEFPGNAEVSS